MLSLFLYKNQIKDVNVILISSNNYSYTKNLEIQQIYGLFHTLTIRFLELILVNDQFNLTVGLK